jgi:hypothetical protein
MDDLVLRGEALGDFYDREKLLQTDIQKEYGLTAAVGNLIPFFFAALLFISLDNDQVCEGDKTRYHARSLQTIWASD